MQSLCSIALVITHAPEIPTSRRTNQYQMERKPNSDIQLPPGFRFHPSDEELIVHYLRNKATSSPLPASIIAEVELYKFNPWELPKEALFGEEWYFFTPRDKKYPNGMRPNRMVPSGYWKATGTDGPILGACIGKLIGLKKALVFYKGRPPRGVKTDWIMHEYRLPPTIINTSRRKGSMRLDDWVLCRVRHKHGTPTSISEDSHGLSSEPANYFQSINKSCLTSGYTKLAMNRNPLFSDCPLLPFIIGSPDLPSLDTVSTTSFGSNKSSVSTVEGNSDGQMLQFSDPSSESMMRTQKRELVETTQQENFIQQCKKLANRDEQKENSPSVSNTKVNFCISDNNFSAAQWNCITHYQEHYTFPYP